MNRANLRAIVFTLAAWGLFTAGRYVPTPFAPTTEITYLGLRPALTAFILVELLSLFLPPLDRFRRQGVAGRRKINRVAVVAWLLLAVAQSYFLAGTLLSSGPPHAMLSGDDFNSGISPAAFRCITILAWTGASVACYFLAEIVSRLGVGNGFCLLMLGDDVIWRVYELTQVGRLASLPRGERFDLTPLLTLAVGGAGAWWVFRRRVAVAGRTADGKTLDFELPLLPQGLPTMTIASGVATMCVLLVELIRNHWPGMDFSATSAYGPALLLLLVILSAALWRLFSGPECVERGTSSRLRFDADLPARLRQQARWALAAMVGASLGLRVLQYFGVTVALPSDDWGSHTLVLLMIAAILCRDAYEQWKFTERCGRAVRVTKFDNVHLAAYVRGLLQSHGIDHYIQAYHLRRLLFVLGPLYKMALYVPTDRVDAVCELIRFDDLTTV